jgi:hypothetical protein
MFGNFSGNALIASDREHDKHYAHCCHGCNVEFGRLHPVAKETKHGDLCEMCAAFDEVQQEVEQTEGEE